MKLKVCGMRGRENILNLIDLKPDFIGFIFYNKSKRFVADFPQVKIPSTIKKVGVFVDENIENLLRKVKDFKLDYVQLHGNESVAYCETLQQQNIKIIKAFSVGNDFNFNILSPFEAVTDYFLFDTKGKERGGNGLVFDWRLLENYSFQKPYFLSGGIGLEESEALLKFIKKDISKYCYALDVNSRFEISPGVKNIEKLKEFKKKLYELFC